MRKMMIAIAGLLMTAQVQAQPYFETQGGAFIGDQTSALYGARVGTKIANMAEGSIGYWGALGESKLHTINLELAELIPIAPRTSVKGLFSLGYTIPDLPGAERGDNGVSWAFGAGLDHELNQDMTVCLNLKWFLFRTDTHLTTYGSHMETLSNGQSAEVLDEYHQDNSVNMNAILLALQLRWR